MRSITDGAAVGKAVGSEGGIGSIEWVMSHIICFVQTRTWKPDCQQRTDFSSHMMGNITDGAAIGKAVGSEVGFLVTY